MVKLKNLKKLEKLKPYALQIDLQPKRLFLTTEGSDNFFNFYNF